MAYTYLIGWSQHKKYYYGVRYSKNCHNEKLWLQYKTSSKYVHEFYSIYGEPDIIEIRRNFDNTDDALSWESKVLRRLNVVKSDIFLNRWDNNMIPYTTDGIFPFERDEIQLKVDKTLRRKYGGRGSSSKQIKDKVYSTNQEKYGTYHTLNNEVVKNARIKSSIEKSGFDNVFKNNDYIKDKVYDKYGVDNVMFVDEVKKKHIKVMQSIDWGERNKKSKLTNIEKYGVTCNMNREGIREKNKLCCPFKCKDNHKFDVGNFTNHMIKIHNWNKEQINEYKIENKKNKNI